ncbi:DUF4625 domain-containing protein [Aequorivita echinoideorum]|uniref:DUF4625 domain-containing protein n=1 Tax=Aequorivita echinoideorum TaxID=1549647 RepID=A0ABS5S6B5_9FLAO|nr:DUF4625 domain-containing protein [Aequorivita echinoideorum]MBT0607375.1 DUF4625 domain-containing protein [Aequorivita echinoideorum]
MKTIIKIFKSINIAFLLFLFLLSCSDDDAPAVMPPQIADLEVGLANSREAFIGSDLHLEAAVLAPGLIQTIAVEISSQSLSWNFQKTWQEEFSGLRNTDFHEHIDISEDAEQGTYTFRIIITDQQGQVVQEEVDLTLLRIEDNVAPTLNMYSTPQNGQQYVEGDVIAVSGMVADNTSLSSLLIVLVREDEGIPDSEINGNHPNVIVMHNIDHFDALDYHEFEAEISVGATFDNNIPPQPITGENDWQSGMYYILAVVTDVVGNKSVSDRYPIEFSL